MDLVDRLYRQISIESLRPKLLLASSHAQGHQLLEQVCKRYGAVLNVEVQTLRGVITDKTNLELFRRQIRLLDEGQTYWIVRLLMKQLADANPTCYINREMLKPGIVDKVHRAVTELRMAGIGSEQLEAELFTNKAKGRYLQQLLDLYEAYLRDHMQTDFAGLAEYVKPGTNINDYLALEPTGWSLVERLMLDSLAGDRLVYLDADAPFYSSEHFTANVFGLFRATGSLAEVREGLRRMLTEPVALDQTEIILSDYDRYAPVLHSHMEEFGIACSFANGLPLPFCAAGKAAVGILDWIEAGYPVRKLTEMLRHGYITFDHEHWSQGDWIRMLERSGIGWGRERYLTVLDPERRDEDEREQGEVLFDHMKKWLSRLPDGNEWHPIRLLEWVADIVAEYASKRSSDDAATAVALRELTSRYSSSPAESMPLEMAVGYVREMLGEIRIRVSATPKPGSVYVSSLQNGGWSGRDRTWIVGMDEKAWSVPTVQDPLLLDEERAALSAELESMGQRARRIRIERESRLSLIRGEVWLSYSSYDAGEQKGQSPAFEMLQVLRLRSGDSTKDFASLEHELGEPYGFIDVLRQGDKRDSIDGVDSWTQLLLTDTGKRRDGWQAVLRANPALAQGYRAQALRRNERLTAYDGWLGLDESANDEGSGQGRHSVSVSQLEHYASCGLKYYFHYVLKLRPKEIAEYDRTRWLQADKRGSLLHEIFRRYLEDVTDRGTRATIHDRSRLTAIVESVIEEYAAVVPAPSVHILAKESEEIRRDTEIFYRNEVSREGQPCFFELELRTDEGEPLAIELPNGTRFALKGFVDRVDRIGPHEYRIIDYKTGNPSKYKSLDYFSGGTQLQHALYSIAVEQWLRDKGIDALARVTEAEYYFPTERGRGEFARRVQNRREELADVLAKLLDSQKRGIYIPAKDTKVCRYCDYQAACGAHAEWMKEKREAELNADTLRSLLEVEAID